MKTSQALVKLKNLPDDTIDYIEDKSQKLLIDSEFNSAIANSKASSIYNASIIIFNNTLIGNTTYDREADYTDENNKIMGLSAININKILDNVGSNDVLHIVLQYKVNGEEKIYKSSNKIVDATGALSSKSISLSNNFIILDIYANNICNSNFEFEEDSTKCCVRIKYAMNIPIETIDEIKNSLKMYIGLGSLNMLTLNNEEEFIPTLDYHPSTKKYVDDAVTNVTDITNSKLDKTLLNGGSSGQILSKKSNTDIDLQWTDPQIKVINPSNLQEFLTMTSENGLYYVPETCNVSIDEFDVSSTSARGDIRSYSLCGLNEVIDEYYYGKKYINYNQNLYFYYDSETEKITDLVILMDYISSIEDAVNILPSKAYVDNKIPTKVSQLTDDTKFKSSYSSDDWTLGDNELYELTVEHNLNSSDVEVSAKNTTDGYEMFIDFTVINDSTICVISDENPDCVVKVIKF